MSRPTKTEHMSYEDLVKEANSPRITAEMLNVLVSRTKELSAIKEHDAKKLHDLLEQLEAKLAQKDA